MEVIKAKHAGACYGVRRALDIARNAGMAGEPVYTLGPLIHNPEVVRELADQGVLVAESVDEIPGGIAIIRSHGVPPDVLGQLQSRNLEVIDATCPHVSRAQKGAAELAENGCRVIVVGEEGHPEVAGLVAYARREGARVDVVSGADDVPKDLKSPIGVVVQTTQRRENLEQVVEAIRRQGIEPQVKDTICSATRLRQDEARELSAAVDAMIVIGGRNSSNTTRLAEICSSQCKRTLHIESAEEIESERFDGCRSIGITAGASTPEDQIEAVIGKVAL